MNNTIDAPVTKITPTSPSPYYVSPHTVPDSSIVSTPLTETGVFNFSPTPGEDRRLVINLVDPTLQAETVAAIQSNDKLSASKLKKATRYFTEGYFYQQERQRILKNILHTNDLYANTNLNPAEKEQANLAMFRRTNNTLLHPLAGERFIQSPDKLKNGITDLIKEYAGDNALIKEVFTNQLRNLLKDNIGTEQAGYKQTDVVITNAWEHVEQLRIDKEAIGRLDQNIQVRIARLAAGERTYYQGNKLDQLLRKYVYGTKAEILANPVVFAIGVFTIKKVVTGVAFSLGSFVAVGAVAGALAATRERYNLQKEKTDQTRREALGETIVDPNKDKGRIEIQKSIMDMITADTIINDLQKTHAILPTPAHTAAKSYPRNYINQIDKTIFDRFAKYRAIIDVSDRERVDLIKYSSLSAVEIERERIDTLLIEIEKFLQEEENNIGSKITSQFDRDKLHILLTHYNERVNEYKIELEEQRKEKDKIFNRMQTSRAAKAFIITAASGAILGGLVQALGSEFTFRGFNPNPFSSKGVQIIPGRLFPEAPPAGPVHTLLTFNGTTIKGPSGIQFIHVSDGNYNAIIGGHVIQGAVINGKLNPALSDKNLFGLSFEQYITHQTVTQTITKHVTQSPVNYLQDNNIHSTSITSRIWVTNNSKVPNLNELGLSYNNTDPDYVSWHLNMNPNGSFIGNTHYDVPSLIQQNKMSVLFSYVDPKGIHYTYAIPVDTNGNAVLQKGSPLWNIFTASGANRANFVEAAQVTNSQATIFATAPLPPGASTIPDIISTDVQQQIQQTKEIVSINIAGQLQGIPGTTSIGPIQIIPVQGQPWQMLFLPAPIPRRMLGKMNHTRRTSLQAA